MRASSLPWRQLWLQLLLQQLLSHSGVRAILPGRGDRCITEAQELNAQSARSFQSLMEGRDAPAMCRQLVQTVINVLRLAYKHDPKSWERSQLSQLPLGQARMLESMTFLIEDILEHGVKGDFMETGVWTGAQSMIIAAVLKAHGAVDRDQWLCDSFQGLPKPDAERFPVDQGDNHWTLSRHSLGGPAFTQGNFQQAGLLNSRQHWEVGFFNDTMPGLAHRVTKLAMLRLDGDMYQSTWEVLVAMYPRLQVGGYVVVADYDLRGCTRAVDDFRARYGITEVIRFPKLPVFGRPGAPFVEMPHQSAYWKKERRVKISSKELHRTFPHEFRSTSHPKGHGAYSKSTDAIGVLPQPVPLTPALVYSEVANAVVTTAWRGHCWFAMWLVNRLRPSVVVDLGVDFGYSTFCFAAPGHGVVYAVDIFGSDTEQGGHGQRSSDHFRHVVERQQLLRHTLGIDNAQLMPGSFEAAAKTFSQWQWPIDILHIDGLHTFAAVAHDYETWRPLLRKEGPWVVLFHDIGAFPEVRRFFDSLPGHKHSFMHSAGLGVLASDADLLSDVEAWSARSGFLRTTWTRDFTTAGNITVDSDAMHVGLAQGARLACTRCA